MAKSYCTNFSNCSKLKERFGVPQQVLNIFINLYNQNVAAENRISADKEYSDEELDEIYNKISTQREENKSNKKYVSKERELAVRSIGGPEALALTELTEVFDANEIEELMQETARIVMDLLARGARAGGPSVTEEDYLAKIGSEGIGYIFNIVTKRYYQKLQEATGILNGQLPAASSNIKTAEKAAKVVGIVTKLLQKGRYSGRVIESLKVLSLSIVNKGLGVRIHGDFSLDAEGTTSYELAESVQETEEPMQERYQQALDAQGLEDSLSGIVSRVLMQLPRTKTVVDVSTEMVGSNEVVTTTTRTEVLTSTVFGEPLYSDPQIVARRLASVLSAVTGEDEMMDTLRGAGYEGLYNILSANPSLRTTFFQEFNRYTQTYRAVNLTKNSDGTVSFSASTLGRNKNEGLNSFKGRLNMGNISDNSIFTLNDSGKVNVKRYTYFRGAYDWFNKIFYGKDAEGKTSFTGSIFDKANPSQKEAYLTSLMEFINIPVTEKGIGILLSDSSKLQSFIQAANTFFSTGDNIIGRDFSGVNRNINGVLFNNTDIVSSINNMMAIVESTPRSFYSTRVSYEGSSLSTMIMSSPLSILAKKVNSLYDRVVDGREVKDLTNFLIAKFLHSPQYRTSEAAGGRVLNRWLADFLYCSDEFLQPCAKSIFGFSRDLGIDHVKVENISDQQHMLLLLAGYFGGRTYATTEDVVHSSEDEAYQASIGNGNRHIVSGLPIYYVRGKKEYRKDVAYIPSFITGDTNAVRQIRTIHYYEDEVLDGMYGLFLSDKTNQSLINYLNERGIVFSANGKEAYTSRQVKENGKKTRRSNADKFGLLQFLNKRIGGDVAESLGLSRDGSKNPTWYEYFISQAAAKQGLNPDALTADERIACEADENTFKEVVSVYLNDGFNKFKAQLEDLGLLSKTPDGKYVYFDKMLPKSNKEETLEKRLREFYFDYKFGQYNQAHLMQVNPLFLNGVEEHQKRNKGTLTNGTALSMEATEDDGTPIWDYDPTTGTYDFTSNVVYFKDVKTGLDDDSRAALINYFTRQFAKTERSLDAARRKAEEHVSRFDSNSLTDGQAYRSLESYRKVLKSAGQQFWTPSHQKAYDLIMSIITPVREARRQGRVVSLTVDEIQQIEDAMAVMQPIKPINDGTEILETDLGLVNIPFQFKYAEVPIVPELLPVGSKLRELGDMMTDLGIDMLASDKCLKKGSFGEMDLQNKKVNGKYVDAKGNILPGMDADGKIIDDGSQTAAQQLANPNNAKKFVKWEEGTSVRDIFNAHSLGEDNPGYSVHKVSMENYLLQSNIPDHTDGNSIVGTQGRKIGTGAIVNSESYMYTVGPSGAKVSGKQLARIYGAAHALKYAKSYKKFTDRIDDTSNIVSDLIYNMVNNGRSNLAAVSRLALVDGQTPTIPFAEPSTATDVQRNLISIFKKTVIRQLISGGSIVQASSLGYGKKALEDTGLHAVIKDGVPVAMQTEMPFDFHYVDDSGNMVQLKYEDYCDENGYFLDEEGKPITEDRYDTAKAKIEVDFPGILDIVAYRIPTEMEYSMFHLRIVKCNPKSTTNTIKLPAECTTIAGFDFDIDKLFLMRHNYKANQPISEYDVWAEFYTRHPEMYNALHQEWVDAGSPENVPLHSYWENVLMHTPSLIDEYGNKDKAYQDVKADLQKELIDRAPIDYNMNPEDLVKMSQGELDNLLIDCMISILSDESTVGDRYTVGGFEGASEDAKIMRLLMAGAWDGDEGTFGDFVKQAEDMEDVKPDYDYSEPMTSIIFKEQNQIAGTLIGIFANDNVNAFISKNLKTLKIGKDKDRILFGSLLDGVTELDGNVENVDSSDIGLSFLHTSVNGKSIKRTLAELLAAAVDAVKDPVLNFLNLNSITADAAAMLARLGYSTRDIGLLFNQPVIKRMCVYMNRHGESNVRRALIEVLKEMGAKDPAVLFTSKAVIDSSGLTTEALARGLNPNSPTDLRMQEAVAQLFNSIMFTKSEFSNYIQQTRNTSANTVKSRFEDYQSSDDKSGREFERLVIETNDTVDYPITNDITEESLLTEAGIREVISKYKDHPFLYENIVAGIINAGMHHMMRKYTLYDTPMYTGFRKRFAELVAPWGLSGDQIEKLYSAIPVMQLSTRSGDFNPDYMSDGETPNAIKYVDREHFLKDLEEFLVGHPELVESPIFAALDIDRANNNGDAERLTLKYSRSISPIEKLSLTLSWQQLMDMGGKAAEIAKGLYLHFYYTRGLNPTTNVVMELAPPSVLKSLIVDENDGLNGLSYADYFDNTLDMYQDGLTSPDANLDAKKKLYQFLISSNADSKLVRSINISLADCKGAGGDESIIFVKSNGEVKNRLDLVTLQAVKEGDKVVGTYYAPVIKVEGKTYVLAEADLRSVDYYNYKKNVDSVKYIPATLVDSRAEDDVVIEKLSKYFTDQNSLIFKDIPEKVSISEVVNDEEVVTDTTESGDSANQAYDSAEEETKDDAVESSDGRPKCHIR